MSDSDRVGHKADEDAGAAEELVGATDDDEDLANEGRAEPARPKFKQVGDDLTDAARHATHVIHK
jgi:uncharacterized protein YjbJ (UPF0337 family)